MYAANLAERRDSTSTHYLGVHEPAGGAAARARIIIQIQRSIPRLSAQQHETMAVRPSVTFSVVRWIPAVDTAVIPVRQTCWRLACQQRNDGYRYRCSVGRMKPCQVGLLRMVRWPLGAEHCWSAAAAAKIAFVPQPARRGGLGRHRRPER